MSGRDSFITYMSKQNQGLYDLLYRETLSRRKRLAKRLNLKLWDSFLSDHATQKKKNSNCTQYMHADGHTLNEVCPGS